MKHLLIVVILTLPLVMFTLVPKVEAIPANPTVLTTLATWGFGQTCAAANLDAISNAGNLITCVICTETPVVVDQCKWDTSSGQYAARWKIEYICR